MRWPRFTLLQLFLVTALIGLLAGWWTQSRQVGKQTLLTALAISPDGHKVAASYSSGIVDVWDISSSPPRQIRSLVPARGIMHEAQFLDDGRIILVRYTNQGTELVRYDPETKRETVIVKTRTPWHKWCVSLDGKVAASCTSATAIDFWDLSTGKVIRRHTLAPTAGGFVHQLELDASGSLLAVSVPAQSQVHMIDVATGRMRVIPSKMMYASAALAADGKSLTIVDWRPPPSWGPEIIVVDLTDPAGKPRCQFTSQMNLRAVRVSRDGSRLLLSSFERMAIWDVPPPEQRWQFDKPVSLSRNWSMDFSILLDQGALSADGLRVVRSAGPNGIVVLDAATGRRLMTVGGTHPLRSSVLYCTAFLVWAVVWGLVSRREKLRLPARMPTASVPGDRFRPVTQTQAWIVWLLFVATLCAALAGVMHGVVGDWLNVRSGFGTFTAVFGSVLFAILGYKYLHLRFRPLGASLKNAQRVVGDSGRQQRHGKIIGLFAGESTIEITYQTHVDSIRQKLAELVDCDVRITNPMLVIGLERADDFYSLNRTSLPHGGIVMTHLFADECRVCEELAHRDGTTASVMLRATISLALLRRHWRLDAPVWLTSILSAWLAADEHRPAALKRAHRLLAGVLGDEAPGKCRELLSMAPLERYQQIFQKDDPAVLRELTLSQAIAVSMSEFLLGKYAGSPRENLLQVIRSVGKRGNVYETIQRVFGHSAADLSGPWWAWVTGQHLDGYDPPPAEARRAIDQLAQTVRPGTLLPPVEQQRNIAVLGSAGDLGIVPTLLAILENPEHSLRAEALWALRGISGQPWEDDPPRWRAWWQEVKLHTQASTEFRPPFAAQWTDASNNDIVLASEVRLAESPGEQQPHAPWQLAAARLVMGAGGVWGIVFAVAASFHSIAAGFVLPILGIGLGVGLLATARSAGRHWWGLRTASGLQTAAIVGCDVVQFAAGIAAARLLSHREVQRYLQRMGGS